MQMTPGTRLGPYEIVSPLGAGGMGEVYRAKDTRLGRFVAIKVLGSDITDPAAGERFAREARTVSALSHPNICPLFDVGEQDRRAYFVMECLEGQTLEAMLVNGGLDVPRAINIASQVADGLAYAHSHRVIHRDLKPGNIMVLPSGLIKILDFGLARKVSGELGSTVVALTQTGHSAGTIAYMSPEQTLGSPLSLHTDIFSLGVVMYEMIAGSRPFAGASIFDIMQQVVNRTPQGLLTIRPHTPPALIELIDRMMAKASADRPRTADEVGATLRAIAASISGPQHQIPSSSGTVTTIMEAPKPPPPLKTVRIRPIATNNLGIAAAALAIVTVIGFATGIIRLPSRTPGDAPAATEAPSATPTTAPTTAATTAAAPATSTPTTSAPASEPPAPLPPSSPPIGAAPLPAPTAITAARASGESLFAQGKFADAAAVWEQAERQAPDDVQVLRNLGSAYQALERYDAAAIKYERAIAIQPTAPAYNSLGTIRFLQRRYDVAAAAFENAVDLNPSFYLYLGNLGDAYRWALGSGGKAKQAYARCIALIEERLRPTPDDPDDRTRLALYLARSGDKARALRELARWESHSQKTPASHFRAAIVFELEGNRNQALAALETAFGGGVAARDIRDEPDLAQLRLDPRFDRLALRAPIS